MMSEDQADELLREKVEEMKRSGLSEENIVHAMRRWKDAIWYRDW